MDTEIKLFESAEFGQARVIPEDDSFWIVGSDVLYALEYSLDTHINKVFAPVPKEWKRVKPIHTKFANGAGQTREMTCLSEQGLYFFLSCSDKPKALSYQKWIAKEVVPSIRRTEQYIVEKPEIIPPDAVQKFQIWAQVLSSAYEGNQLTLALDKCAVRLTGESALRVAQVELIAEQQMNKHAEAKGWQKLLRPAANYISKEDYPWK